MLYQTDLCLAPFDASGLDSGLAVKLHGAAMRAVPQAFAGLMHTNAYHPFSIFTRQADGAALVRISALTDEARAVPEALSGQPFLRIFGAGGPIDISVIAQQTAAPLPLSALEDRVPAQGCRLEFASPAMIRIKSQPCAVPEPAAYFYSVIRKYELFAGGGLSYPEFQEAFRAVRFGAFQLRSDSYDVTGRRFPGMSGFCELLFPRDLRQNRLLRRTLAYAAYSGVGSRTAQGMGGILIAPLT